MKSNSFRAGRLCCGPPVEMVVKRVLGIISFDSLSGLPTADVSSFAFQYISDEILSKYAAGELPDAEEVTFAAFFEAESRCSQANKRLDRWATSPYAQEISLARNWIRRVLGKFDMDKAAHYFGFGPGATTRLSRRKSDRAWKYTGIPEATHNCAAFAEAIIGTNDVWSSSTNSGGRVAIAQGNRITTVPKNRKKRRIIAIEPCMNMYVQKGIGGLIRRRLKLVGVDLNDQSINQRLALFGSESGRLATIDLSMASDCVSKSLVEALLPPDWLQALGMCRSEIGVLPGGVCHLYRKWSSMGNGYTFELESLVFAALLKAVHHNASWGIDSSVYGDDLILPVEFAGRFIELLEFCGFKTNESKSFIDGPFRESCGKHYYRGFDVSPFYVKTYDRSLLSLFLLHNQLRRFVSRSTWLADSSADALLGVCAWLRSYAPAAFRKQSILDGLGDGAFVGSFDEVRPSICRKAALRGWETHYIMESFVPTNVLQRDELPVGALISSLLSVQGEKPFHLYPMAVWKDSRGPQEGITRGQRVRRSKLRIPARLANGL